MRKVLLLSTFILITIFAKGQFGFEFDASIPVLRFGDTLKDAWGGGFNYAQVSDFDFDFDGDLDLFVFDRSSNNIRVLIQEDDGNGPYYRSCYNAQSAFPSDIRYRATMVDYDMDGRKDLFSYGIGGIKVHRNIGDATNGIQWELISDLLYSVYPTITTNLYVSSSDIPAIIDVDFDGDIDILTFDISGNHVEYHQNQSMELYGIPDSLIFELKNKCWGKFGEDINTNAIILNDPSSPCTDGNVNNPEFVEYKDATSPVRHTGSTILALDYDNSGVLDLIVGDVSFSNLNLLINGGVNVNTDSPMITYDPNFPSNTTAVNLELFPAAFYVDVDFDGIKDIVACPNAKNISENETSIMYYKNLGTDVNPNFIYLSPNLLQAEMIEHGAGTLPVITDIDEDGLEDLIVSNLYRFLPGGNKESTMAYYKNTGTSSNPIFTFVDYNYLNLNQEGFGLRIAPTCGDNDGDGDKDMFLGLADGTLVYYENFSSGSGSVFTSYVSNFTDNLGNTISTNGYCSPQLFDLNNDNLIDLILGKKDGGIMYYENIGTTNSPSFELVNDNLGLVNVSSPVNPDGFATPQFVRNNDTTYLIVGSEQGRIFFYDSIDFNLNPLDSFNLVNSNFLGIDVQKYSAPFVAEIDGDTNLHLLIGQDLGGLLHFEADPNSNAGLSEESLIEFGLYPNPASNEINLVFSEKTFGEIEVYDMNGNIQLVQNSFGTKTTLDISNFSRGVYLLKFVDERGRIGLKKFILR